VTAHTVQVHENHNPTASASVAEEQKTKRDDRTANAHSTTTPARAHARRPEHSRRAAPPAPAASQYAGSHQGHQLLQYDQQRQARPTTAPHGRHDDAKLPQHLQQCPTVSNISIMTNISNRTNCARHARRDDRIARPTRASPSFHNITISTNSTNSTSRPPRAADAPRSAKFANHARRRRGSASRTPHRRPTARA